MEKTNSFNDFFNGLFIPYAYAVLLKVNHGIDMIFGELSHGDEGEIEDYIDAFNSSSKSHALKCLNALSVRKRVANKKPCPCGCQKRLGICSLHLKLNGYRTLPRCFFRNAYNKLIKDSDLNDKK